LHQGARLEAACRVAAGALVEVERRRGVPPVVDLGRESSDVSDAKAVVVLDEVRSEQQD
jgi:hypothetical protein